MGKQNKIEAVRKFKSGSTRDADNGKLDYEAFISPLVLERFARYMHSHKKQADGSVRDGDNWQRGLPRSSYRKSLIRHVIDLWLSWRMNNYHNDQEDLLCAVLFNAQGLLFEILNKRDLKG